ncbi:MAG: metallophosphoesterase, partial [Clostridium sp.]|nr:metallophosphoesterase [Clostridium sp.]
MKIKAIKLMGFILILGAVIAGCSFYKSYNEGAKQDTDSAVETSASDADLSFGVFGDVHNYTDNFKDAVDDFYDINPKMDALVLNGDAVDQGIDEQYDSMKKAIEKNSKKIPEILIKNIGNHEFYNYSTGGNTQEDINDYISKYLDFSGTEKVYHDKWIKGYHFISLGSDETTNAEDLDTTQASLSEEQLSWFKEKLKEEYTKGKPIFVFLHQAIFTDFFGEDWHGVRQGDEFTDILKDYPEVIIFSSHDHKDFADDSIHENMPYTMAYTGAVGYTLFRDE